MKSKISEQRTVWDQQITERFRYMKGLNEHRLGEHQGTNRKEIKRIMRDE